ncbi:hypothetical protein [Maricaulis maris]|uniref:Uncharacterized protein n=1 Tax=Maricaulis maris TaxID=74318 RepID=A0A495DJ74_9PROT|nr:hypothetical protein [Maricaulis maris]RKR02689.1 hypothetical protein C7435_0628 [Maricaulis maris]
MLGRLSATLRAGVAGALIMGAFTVAAVPASYMLGRSHARNAQTVANYDAVVERVGQEAARLAGVATIAEARLEEDRAWRAQHVADFLADSRQLAADAAAARRAFDESADRSCPAHDDDVRLFNRALGLTAAEPRAGDPGSGADRP